MNYNVMDMNKPGDTMDIAILIGNTNTKIALINKDSIKNVILCRTEHIDTAIRKNPEIKDGYFTVYIASVVPEATGIVKKYTGKVKEITWKDFPFKIDVRHPEKIGIDRLLNAAGTRKLFKTACVVIDAGSAITIDLVDIDGNFKGGVIFPGQRLIIESLKNLALLKDIKPSKKTKSIIGKDTSEAINSGITYGLCFLVAGYINAIKKKNKKVKVVFTGGGGKFLQENIKTGIYEKHLGLKGLQMVVYGNS
ncbi:MAG TPA: type III pantothenate kinase [bacterium]|nr:type III pantothenate kinase [bacterium]